MPLNEKGQPEGRPIPNFVRQDNSETKASAKFAQELARSVFGRAYIVVHEPITTRFRCRAPSRIRAWRASNGR